MTLLEDIVAYLVAQRLVKGDGEDIFRDFKPDTPDNIVSLHEYKGDPVSPHTQVVHRSVQIIVRNKSATAAQSLCKDIFAAFRKHDEAQRLNLTPDRWGQVHLRQTPYKILQDDKDRTHYGFNLGITTTID